MPKLKGKNGEWTLPQVEAWHERKPRIRFVNRPWIRRDARIFVIGACTAVWISASLRRHGFQVTTHPDGHFYNSRSLLQALQVASRDWPKREEEPIWQTSSGFMDPFALSYRDALPSR